jgi:hypothetical protein
LEQSAILALLLEKPKEEYAAMKKICTAASLAVLLAATGAVAQTTGGVKMSKAECQSLWGEANASGSGNLSGTQASAYFSDIKSVDSNGDGQLSSAEFMAGCQKGLAHASSSSGAGTGTSGASGSSGSSAPPKQQY